MPSLMQPLGDLCLLLGSNQGSCLLGQYENHYTMEICNEHIFPFRLADIRLTDNTTEALIHSEKVGLLALHSRSYMKS